MTSDNNIHSSNTTMEYTVVVLFNMTNTVSDTR